MGDRLNTSVANEECDEIWEWISEFICWEFCKATAQEGITEVDLIDFFKKMIIKKASKELNKVQTCEAVAKFIEQVNIVVNEKTSVTFLDQYADLVVKTASHLKPLTENLIDSIQDFLSSENENPHGNENAIISIQEFSHQVFQSLPLPYLIKIRRKAKLNYSDNFEKPFSPPTKDVTMLLKQINLSEDNLTKVRSNIDEDKLFQDILSNPHLCSEQKDYEYLTSSINETDKECKVDDVQKTSHSKVKPSKSKRKGRSKLSHGNSMNLDTSQSELKLKRISDTYSSSETPPRTIPSFPKKLSRTSSTSTIKTELNDFKEEELPKRKRNPWTDEEEELLVKGIKKYGVGYWALIRSDGGLDQRSVRDLYDKWKNIQKYNHLKTIENRIHRKKK